MHEDWHFLVETIEQRLWLILFVTLDVSTGLFLFGVSRAVQITLDGLTLLGVTAGLTWFTYRHQKGRR